MTNDLLWQTIEIIAQEHGLTCSGLARCCNLDATIFNKCKRKSKYGQPRWLSTETIAKIMTTFNIDARQFAEYVSKCQNN